MAYTKFGEFMRIQRIKKCEVMGDTAKLFNVTIPFVSAVENGKRNIPKEWVPIIVKHYSLTKAEEQDLKQAIEESKTQIKVNLSEANQFQRKVALQFQRSFEEIDEETAESIIKLLSRK